MIEFYSDKEGKLEIEEVKDESQTIREIV